LEVSRTIVDALEEKKGEDIVLLDLQGVVLFTDYFVICSGTSDRMLRALMEAALDKVRDEYKLKTRVEGEVIDGWLLADFGDVILHIFSKAQRDYYSLEELWKEGKVLLHVQ
jgi:ribosome-associated protein